MGIGNLPAVPQRQPRRDVSGCSLPLMGIGNPRTRIRRAQSAVTVSHYPSWGSETHRLIRRVAIANREAAHYPSWGSETSEGSMLVAGMPPHLLITPHGDRKHARGTLRRNDHAGSLPLMGIGNAQCVGHQWPPWRGRGTHYPSWGSETPAALNVARTPAPEISGSSLPLMGIGNRRRRSVASRPTSDVSLPLMGIGNVG